MQERIGYLLKRPVGRPSLDVRRSYTNFTYQAGSWTKPRRVVAKVEWHPGELYPRVGFIVTNMASPRRECRRLLQQARDLRAVDQRGQGRDSRDAAVARSFAANAVRLQLHALAYNLGNFLRTLATPEPIKDWSLTSLKEKLIKIGAKVVRHGRYVAFQMAEVAVPRHLFVDILRPTCGTTAAAGHVNSVISSICHAFQEKPWETRVLMKENSACLSAQARAAPAPKHIYKPESSRNDILFLSKSRDRRTLATIGPSTGECRLKRVFAVSGQRGNL